MFYRSILSTVIVSILFAAHAVYADGLDTLAGVGKAQGEMQKILERETKAYNAVKDAFLSGKLKEGQSQEEVLKRYGEPVVVIAKRDAAETWVYKPGYVSHLDDVKIRLSFDAKKRLAGITLRKGAATLAE